MSRSESAGTAGVQESWQLYRRLMRYAWPYRWMFALAAVGMVLLSATAGGFAAVMKPLVDEGFVNRDPGMMRIIPLVIVGLFILRGLATVMAEYTTTWISRRVIFDVRNSVFRHLVRLPSAYYERQSSGGLVAKLIFDLEQIAAAVTQAVFTIVSDGLTAVALLAWLFYVNWRLTLILIVLLPLSTFLLRLMSKRFRKTSEQIQLTMGEISRVAQEAAEGQRVVKAYRGQDTEMRAFLTANERNRKQVMRRTAVSSIGMSILQLIGALGLAVVMYTALVVGKNTAGDFVSYLTAVTWLMGPTRRLAKINEVIQTGLAAAQSAFALLDEPPEADTGTASPAHVSGQIEYDRVGFRYAMAEDDALTDVSFNVEPGQTVALVGSSGSGKTTCLSLLPRFYRVGRGSIRIDGIDINDFRLDSLRSCIALVGQESLLFDDTIRNNIAYGAEGDIDQGRLREAAHAAHVLEFADRLPEGLDARVGERGMRLSGGQRQRVAIARALYKDSPILILDEATSALDSESERYVQDAMRELTRNRTTLVIAHRLSTVESADRILVFAQGRIVESGTHGELLARNGVYAGLYRSQFNEAAA